MVEKKNLQDSSFLNDITLTSQNQKGSRKDAKQREGNEEEIPHRYGQSQIFLFLHPCSSVSVSQSFATFFVDVAARVPKRMRSAAPAACGQYGTRLRERVNWLPIYRCLNTTGKYCTWRAVTVKVTGSHCCWSLPATTRVAL